MNNSSSLALEFGLLKQQRLPYIDKPTVVDERYKEKRERVEESKKCMIIGKEYYL